MQTVQFYNSNTATAAQLLSAKNAAAANKAIITAANLRVIYLQQHYFNLLANTKASKALKNAYFLAYNAQIHSLRLCNAF